jgi:hypothetical protein
LESKFENDAEFRRKVAMFGRGSVECSTDPSWHTPWRDWAGKVSKRRGCLAIGRELLSALRRMAPDLAREIGLRLLSGCCPVAMAVVFGHDAVARATGGRATRLVVVAEYLLNSVSAEVVQHWLFDGHLSSLDAADVARQMLNGCIVQAVCPRDWPRLVESRSRVSLLVTNFDRPTALKRFLQAGNVWLRLEDVGDGGKEAVTHTMLIRLLFMGGGQVNAVVCTGWGGVLEYAIIELDALVRCESKIYEAYGGTPGYAPRVGRLLAPEGPVVEAAEEGDSPPVKTARRSWKPLELEDLSGTGSIALDFNVMPFKERVEYDEKV